MRCVLCGKYRAMGVGAHGCEGRRGALWCVGGGGLTTSLDSGARAKKGALQPWGKE